MVLAREALTKEASNKELENMLSFFWLYMEYSTRNSHENFKKGNMPCLSLEGEKCH